MERGKRLSAGPKVLPGRGSTGDLCCAPLPAHHGKHRYQVGRMSLVDGPHRCHGWVHVDRRQGFDRSSPPECMRLLAVAAKRVGSAGSGSPPTRHRWSSPSTSRCATAWSCFGWAQGSCPRRQTDTWWRSKSIIRRCQDGLERPRPWVGDTDRSTERIRTRGGGVPVGPRTGRHGDGPSSGCAHRSTLRPSPRTRPTADTPSLCRRRAKAEARCSVQPEPMQQFRT